MAPYCIKHLSPTYFVEGVGKVHLEDPLPDNWDLRVIKDCVCRVNGGLRPSSDPNSKLVRRQILCRVRCSFFGDAFGGKTAEEFADCYWPLASTFLVGCEEVASTKERG